MAAIKNQPAPKPGSLSTPVPGAQQKSSIDNFLANYSAPEVEVTPTPAPAPQGSSLDRFLSEQGVEESVPEIPAEQFAEEPGFAEANIDQFGQFTTRLQAGLAANDTEKLEFLKQKYGPNNAVLKDDKLFWRKNTAEKFKPLDPATFELLNDVLPDWSREIVQELTMLPAEIGGAAAGGIPGAIGARVISVPAANAIADKVAEAAGVPRDESRSRLAENLVGMGAEGIIPVVGRAVVKPILKHLPGTRSYQKAVQEGERELVALSKQSAEVAKSVAALNEVGRAAKINGELVGIPGAEVNLMGHQMNPDSPILQRFAQQAANDPRFVNAQQQLAEDWGSSLENTLKEIGRRGVKSDTPYKPEFLAQSVKNAVDEAVQAEGKEIGKYKLRAMSKIGNKPQSLPPQIAQKAQELMTAFKFQTTPDGKILPPKNIQYLAGTMGLTTAEARKVVNNLQQLAPGLKKGLSLDHIDALRNNIGGTSASLRGEASAKLGSLAGDLRQMYRETISSGLDDPFDKAAFNSAMDEYSTLRTNVGVLKNALDEDASRKAIVRSFFTGKDNLDKVKRIKAISPESFSNLKEEFVDQLLNEYSSRETATGIKSSQFLDAVNKKYGSEFLQEVFDGADGPGLKEVKDLLTVTERIDKTFRSAKPDQMSEQQKKGMMDLMVGVAANVKFKALNGMSALIKGRMPKDHPLFEIMTREGFDKYVRDYPGKIDRRSTLRKLNDMLADVKLYRQVEAAGAETVKRGTKQYLRQKTQGAFSGD